jgi:hypothetical protein
MMGRLRTSDSGWSYGRFQEIVCSPGMVEVITDLKSPVEIFEWGTVF